MNRHRIVLGALAAAGTLSACTVIFGLHELPPSAQDAGADALATSDVATDPSKPDVEDPCSKPCTPGEPSRCTSEGVETCSTGGGCAHWQLTACGPHAKCVAGGDGGVPSCVCEATGCQTDGVSCQGESLRTCATDPQGCKYVDKLDACTPPTAFCNDTEKKCTDKCETNCAIGDKECRDNVSIAACEEVRPGCTRYAQTPTACGAHRACTGDKPAAECTCLPSPCTSASPTCQDSLTKLSCAMINGCPHSTGATACGGATPECQGGDCVPCSAVAWPAVSFTNTGVAGPPPRALHGMTYDSTRKNVIVVAGVGNGGAMLQDTHKWNGATWSAGPTTFAGGAPARHYVVIAFDAAAGKVVMFGGADGSTNYLGDTLTWDGVSASWVYVCATASCGPGARVNHAMTYDAERKVVVMYGGQRPGGTPLLDDTWEFSGATNTWTRKFPAASPPPSSTHSLAYDSKRKRVVAFGGSLADAWEYDGNTWTQRIANPTPTQRSHGAMVFDESVGRIVYYGGSPSGTYTPYDERWDWDGTCWKNTTAATPSSRNTPRMAYDAVHSKMVLFGGSAPPPSNAALSDTWTSP